MSSQELESRAVIRQNIEIELAIRVCDDLTQLPYGNPWYDLIETEPAKMEFIFERRQ